MSVGEVEKDGENMEKRPKSWLGLSENYSSSSLELPPLWETIGLLVSVGIF